jgi:hypothetical protein
MLAGKLGLRSKTLSPTSIRIRSGQAVLLKYTTPPKPTKSNITIKKNHLFVHEQPPEQTKSRIKKFTNSNQSSQIKSW